MRVAVFVDGDNLSARFGPAILDGAGRHGRVDVARVYLDANANSGWLSVQGYRAMHAGTGKNASDLLLAIDAVDLTSRGGFDAVVIASSDGDFVHLAQRLRENGIKVVGVGEAKTTPAYRSACTAFVELAAEKPAQRVMPTPLTPTATKAIESSRMETAACCEDLEQRVRLVIAAHSQKAQGMPLVRLGTVMWTLYGVKSDEVPDGNWRKFLEQRSTLFALDGTGQGTMVRFLPKAFAAE